MIVVSTSSVMWSQVRWYFVLEYFHAINHDEQENHFGYLQCFILYMSNVI